MAVHASHAALPYAIKGARYTLFVPYLDADGDPTAPTTPDTEITKDNAAAADCAEEASATSGMDGMAMMTLSGAETDCSLLALNAKVASGPKATLATLYPRVLASVGTGTLSAGSAGGGTLGTLLAYDVTGCFIKTTGGTGGGGTGGANNQARRIVTYNVSTGAFTVEPNWETTPDNTTTYAVLLPEGMTLGMLKALNPTTPGRTLVVDAAGLADANVVKAGPTGSGVAVEPWSATRGLAGTALPAAAADAAGGLPTRTLITDARLGALDDWLNGGRLDLILDIIAADTTTDIPAMLTAIDDFLDTEVAAILAAVDTEVAAIKAKTDNLPASPAAVGSAMTLATGAVSADALATDAVTEITDAILALVIETGLTFKNAMRLIAAAAAGKLSGAATNTVVIRNAVADDKDRITATVDSDGNRSAITLDLT